MPANDTFLEAHTLSGSSMIPTYTAYAGLEYFPANRKSGLLPNDVVTVAVDFDAATPTVRFYCNGVFNYQLTRPKGVKIYPVSSAWGGANITFNFGKLPFVYFIPGYKPWNPSSKFLFKGGDNNIYKFDGSVLTQASTNEVSESLFEAEGSLEFPISNLLASIGEPYQVLLFVKDLKFKPALQLQALPFAKLVLAKGSLNLVTIEYINQVTPIVSGAKMIALSTMVLLGRHGIMAAK